MCLNADSIKWAINFVNNHSDGDLFPKILEYEAISAVADDFVQRTEGKDLSTFPPSSSRRFIVPKDEISYRQATQLDPQDSIFLSAIIYQFGKGIEDRRFSRDEVFSYRFKPDLSFGLYDNKNAWNDFWSKALQKSKFASYVLYCDIADFYNQLYHHTIENQLLEATFPNQAIKWIIKLLESTTAGVSRGVPVGPHGIHLLSEAAMIPIDNSFKSNGYDFLRYVDDILFFCDSEASAKRILSSTAAIIDKQQRLTLQRHKTKILNSDEFREMFQSMIEDRPISEDENKVLDVVKKYSGGDPYRSVSYAKISEKDWLSLTDEMINQIIHEYLDSQEVDYIHLRWFYRRLTQIGHPGAIDVTLKEISKLGPCFANICHYLASVQNIDPEKWKDLGRRLLELLDAEDVRNNEYFRLSILSLFSKNININHLSNLIQMYSSSEPFARREILLAAKTNAAFDWLREHKESYTTMDPWQKMAYIYGISGLPKDEKKYFINSQSFNRPFESVLAQWAKKT